MSRTTRAPEPDVNGLRVALETSTSPGSVAVWRGELLFEETEWIRGVHSQRLLPAIARALTAVGATADEVTDLVVGSGPGSFTGVRIAASLVKGWVEASGCSLFAYSSLLASAVGAGWGQTCALFDARRGEVYAAGYEIGPMGFETFIEPRAGAIGDLLQEIESRGLSPTFTGEGAVLHQQAISAAFGPDRVLQAHLGLPRAASLLWLREVAPDAGRVERPRDFRPLYVRDWKVPEAS